MTSLSVMWILSRSLVDEVYSHDDGMKHRSRSDNATNDRERTISRIYIDYELELRLTKAYS